MQSIRSAAACAAATVLLATGASGPATGADHQEAPGTRVDPAADIADLYAWHDTAANRLTVALTYDGLQAPGPRARGTFEENVYYVFHLDNDGDFLSDLMVVAYFMDTGKGLPDLVVADLPGADGPVSARVGTIREVAGGQRIFAGLRDDPFFFDLEGFLTTLQTGTLSFNGMRDSVAGLNASAIVLEMDLAAALDGGSALNLWATTSRN